MFTSHSIAHVQYTNGITIRRLWRLIDSSMERSHCNACRIDKVATYHGCHYRGYDYIGNSYDDDDDEDGEPWWRQA